jgi:hypothetical protein
MTRKKIAGTLGALLFCVACAPSSNSNPVPQSTTPSNPKLNVEPEKMIEPLAWESSGKPERTDWSSYVAGVNEEEFDRLDLATDTENFCPNYKSLTHQQKINFWGQLIAGVAYFESGWSPTSRMKEPSLGKDSVTGMSVYSEGLLSLSYQDVRSYGFCDFDWTKDKDLESNDPKRTILNPYTNLDCGIRILANQISRSKAIVLSSGVYWSVLRKSSTHVPQIQAMTKKLSFCHSN